MYDKVQNVISHSWTRIETTMTYHDTLNRMAEIKKTTPSTGKEVEKQALP